MRNGLNGYSRQKMDDALKELSEVKKELDSLKETHKNALESSKFTEKLLSDKVVPLFTISNDHGLSFFNVVFLI
jgi:hypothetical protein